MTTETPDTPGTPASTGSTGSTGIAVVDELRTVLAEHDLGDALVSSLRQAGSLAGTHLDAALHDVLEWPEDVDAYCDYLARFARWIPQQSDDPAWQTSTPHERQAKEVSDRLAHFYWLVDQPLGDDAKDTLAGSSRPFRDWLTRYARAWGDFLDTPESFSDDILRSFLDDAPDYDIGESLLPDGRANTPSGWVTFNQFFARELNPGLRPTVSPGDNTVVACPADCSYIATYDIGADSAIPATTLKQTHTYGTITELLADSPHADAFAGGTFVHYMLPPSAYHRFHLPVSGEVLESRVIQGRVYMQVELQDGQLVSLDAAQSGYEFTQTRGAVVIDTSGSPDGDVGLVAVVPVGMSHVASVSLTPAAGAQVVKGDEFGFFQFGGSDIIVLFQAGRAVDIDSSGGPRRTGTAMARCR